MYISVCVPGRQIYFRQIVTNVFVQIVVLLYLIDNNDNTSWMILMGSGIGVVIEAWKVVYTLSLLFRRSSPPKLDHQSCRYQIGPCTCGFVLAIQA